MEELRHNATFSDEARMKLAGMEQRHRRRTGQVPHETKQLGQAGDVPSGACGVAVSILYAVKWS